MPYDKIVQEEAILVPDAGDLKLAGAPSIQPRCKRYVACKAALEWLMALMLLALAAPLVLVLAALVRLTSSGPAFYRQVRLGRHGRPFSIYKIRSMTQNCEAVTGPVWSGANDPRVTRIGRILRDTHLDELPQLWNVLRGEMSLVGPRPERPELVARLERVIPRYQDRLQLRPGLTGLAQVQLPADNELSDVRRKLAYDLYYVRELNLWLDARIAVCTLFHLSALCLNSVGKLFVKSCAQAIEGEVHTRPLFSEESRQVRTA